jgi:hypothetical protein
MRNEDVIDLYRRVSVGTKVIVLPGDQRSVASEAPVDSRPDGTVRRSAAGVMTTPISAGPRDLGIHSRGAWNESVNPRTLY